MAGRSMALDVLVRLRDNLSGPLRRLRGNLSQLAGFARKIGVLGAAIGAISFLGPIKEAAAFQQELLDIAGTAELSGKAAFSFVDEIAAKYERLAIDIGQSSNTIAEGSGLMIAAGINRDLIDQTIDDIGRAATAANASFSDMAGVGTSMLQNLKLPADEMRDALGALVVAGKEGAFELKDMAATFPNLTSGVAKFGVKGREAVNFLASALQIARKGTADPGQAANNLANFLDKALSPLTKKNFKDHGVDIEAVMMDAVTKGFNPVEAVIQKIGKLTGVSESSIAGYMKDARKHGLEGAEALGYVREQLEAIGAAGKIGELFQDKQVLDFLVPFLANIDEYKAIKEKVAAASGAAIDADFETQMAGINRELMVMQEIGTQSVRMVGFAFAEWLPVINGWLLDALTWVRELDKSTGGLVKKVLSFGGAGLLAVAAVGALGIVLPIVGAGLAAIGALIGVILSPIGLLVAALGGGAAYIWKNWDRFGPRLMRLWDRAKRVFGDLADWVVDKGRGIGAALEGAWRTGDWRGIGRSMARSVASGFSQLRTALGEIASAAVQRLAAMDWSDLGAQIGREAAELGASLGRAVVGGLRLELGAASDLGGLIASKLVELDWKAVGRAWLAALRAQFDLISGAIAGIGESIQSAIEGWFDVDLTAIGARWGKQLLAGLQSVAADIRAWVQSILPASIGEAIKNNNAAAAGAAVGGMVGKPNGGSAGAPPVAPPSSGYIGAPRVSPDKQSAIGSGSKFAALRTRQEVVVGGAVRIQVEGPGRVAGVSSDNAQVPVTAGNGRMIGRV